MLSAGSRTDCAIVKVDLIVKSLIGPGVLNLQTQSRKSGMQCESDVDSSEHRQRRLQHRGKIARLRENKITCRSGLALTEWIKESLISSGQALNDKAAI